MVERIQFAPQGPEFSRIICGYWRLMEWGMTPQQLLRFIELHIALRVKRVCKSRGCQPRWLRSASLRPSAAACCGFDTLRSD